MILAGRSLHEMIDKTFVNALVRQDDTGMLSFWITFVSVEIKWLKWCQRLNIIMLATQPMADLQKNQDHSGLM